MGFNLIKHHSSPFTCSPASELSKSGHSFTKEQDATLTFCSELSIKKRCISFSVKNLWLPGKLNSYWWQFCCWRQRRGNSWGRTAATDENRQICDNKGQKLEVLPHTGAHKFHQSTPAEGLATRPSCSDQRWPEKAKVRVHFTPVLAQEKQRLILLSTRLCVGFTVFKELL